MITLNFQDCTSLSEIRERLSILSSYGVSFDIFKFEMNKQLFKELQYSNIYLSGSTFDGIPFVVIDNDIPDRLKKIESTLWEMNALIERRTNEFARVVEEVMKQLEDIKKEIKKQ